MNMVITTGMHVLQELMDRLDTDLEYAIRTEGKMAPEDITNYQEVRAEIREALEGLRDVPNREETPLIYHLDVAAMYPNIILTNRHVPGPSSMAGHERRGPLSMTCSAPAHRQSSQLWLGHDELYIKLTSSRRSHILTVQMWLHML